MIIRLLRRLAFTLGRLASGAGAPSARGRLAWFVRLHEDMASKMTKHLGRDDEFDKPPVPVTTHLGRASEYLVAAQLLRMGYNTSPLPVDTGVDLLAHWNTKSGDSRVALIQVKGTAASRTTITLNKAQFDRITGHGVNLAVVFWLDPECPFTLVIPPALFYMLTSGNFRSPAAPIRSRPAGATIVFVAKGRDRVFIRNLRTDLSLMVNRFDRLAASDEDPHAIPDYAEWATDDEGLLRIVPDEEAKPNRRIQLAARRARRS